MTPIEFKITQYTDDEIEGCPYKITFFYSDKTKSEINFIGALPKGLELNKHYAITDLYGYKVIGNELENEKN